MSYTNTPVATPTQDDPYAGLTQQLVGPQNQLADLQAQQGLAQAGFGMAQNQLGAGQAQQSYQQQLANLLLRQQGYGIDQAALLRQFNPATGQGLLSQQHDLSDQGLAAAMAQAQFGALEQNRSAWSGATARGATNTQGFQRNLSDISTQEKFSEDAIARQQLQSGLQYGEQRSALTDALARLNLQMGHGALPANPYPGMGGVDIANLGLGQNLTNALQGYNINNASLGSAAGAQQLQVPIQQQANANQVRSQFPAPAGPTALPPPPPPPGAVNASVSHPGGRRMI